MAESKKSVYAAIAADTGIAVAKFVAAGFSGSAGMLAEGIHSVIDTVIAALMLLGIDRSEKKPDRKHPFGYSMEMYYWSNVVSLLLFSFGGGMSILQGVWRLIDPEEPGSFSWNYGVLAVSAALTVYSFSVAYRQLRASRPDQGLWRAIRTSKEPRNFSVLLLDAGDISGVGLAFFGVLLGQLTGSPYPDGVAAVLIGLILAGIAVVLANESRHLLIGESADDRIVREIRSIVEQDPAVERAPRPFTMHLGPDEILLALDVRFRDDLAVSVLSTVVKRLERAIRAKHPQVKRIFLQAKSLSGRRKAKETAEPAPGSGTVARRTATG